MDLQVSDVARAREFFETLFDLRCVYQRADQIALLEDGAGFSLGLSNLFGSGAAGCPIGTPHPREPLKPRWP
ncbi:MAG: VOC family protein [Gemmatimonadetes bacterium]|nr:VOC family protein [Gemmatimonadota bacterium]